LKPLLHLVPVFLAAVAHPAATARAAAAEWLEGTVLADCAYCASDAFDAARRKLANQLGPARDPASGMGYVVTLDDDGPFVWGRAALVGTGNLIRTDAHVLFTDAGELKLPEGEVYFQHTHHRDANDLIEIDLSSAHRGGAVSARQADIKNDWAIAGLREDAIEKFKGDRIFAFLWGLRVNQNEIVKPEYMRTSVLVLGHAATFAVDASCQSVTDDDPSRYAFGVDEIFFLRCPPEALRVGTSGSVLAILSPDETWSLGGQLIGGGMSRLVRAGAGRDAELGGPLGHQIFLGNVPAFRQTLNRLYLQELIRRGMDPRDRERRGDPAQ